MVTHMIVNRMHSLKKTKSLHPRILQLVRQKTITPDCIAACWVNMCQRRLSSDSDVLEIKGTE